MARSRHERQLDRAGAHRGAEHTERQQGIRLVLALVAVLVVAAMALGAVLLNRGSDDVNQADAVEPTPEQDQASSEDASGEQGDEAAAAPGEGGEDAADEGGADGESSSATAGEPCPPAAGGLPDPTTTPYGEAPVVDLGEVETVRVTLSTTCGTITVDLDAAAAPTTVANFVALAEDGYYEGVGFHRVLDGFMIQGGDPTGTGTGCLDGTCEQRLPGYTFADELELAEEVVAETGGYPRGTLAMANAGPDTNGSQFFIVQATPGYPLPPNYAVFGQVVEGMAVVDRIARGPVDGDLAVDPVIIQSVQVER